MSWLFTSTQHRMLLSFLKMLILVLEGDWVLTVQAIFKIAVCVIVLVHSLSSLLLFVFPLASSPALLSHHPPPRRLDP